MKKDEPDYIVVYTYKLESIRSIEEDFDLVESFAKENDFKLSVEKARIDINRRTGSVCNLLYNSDKQKK